MEFNKGSAEYTPLPKDEENPSSPSENNAFATEFSAFAENHDSTLPEDAPREVSPPAPKKKPSFVQKLAYGAAAVVGVAVIGNAYVDAVRTEKANFKEVFAEENRIVMEVEIEEWSEDLKIRIRGKDFEDYIELAPPETFADEKQEKYTAFYEYLLHDLKEEEVVTVELIGSKVLMNEVLDTRVVTVTGERVFDSRGDPPPDTSPEEEDVWPDERAVLLSAFYGVIDDVYTVQMWLDVPVWSENLRIRLSATDGRGDEFEEFLQIKAPGETSDQPSHESFYEYSFNDDTVYETVTVQILGYKNRMLDEHALAFGDEWMRSDESASILSAYYNAIDDVYTVQLWLNVSVWSENLRIRLFAENDSGEFEEFLQIEDPEDNPDNYYEYSFSDDAYYKEITVQILGYEDLVLEERTLQAE